MQRHYKLRSSQFLVLLDILLAVSALVTLWLLPLPVWMSLALTLVLLCWVGNCLLLDAKLRLGRSCVAFRLENREEIVLVLRNGLHLPGHVLPYSLVTPYLVILNILLSEQRGKRSVLICPDTMSVESFRRLRVALRWGDMASQSASI